MLNAEEAKARLESVRQARWHAAATRRANSLHRKLRPLASILLQQLPTTYQPDAYDSYYRELKVAAEAIDALGDKDREAIMSALHPQLATTLARWWVDAQGQPYLTGWNRRGYRAPKAAKLTVEWRSKALREIVWMLGPYDRDALWLAAWAPFIESAEGIRYSTGFVHSHVGPLLAAAIDAGGRQGDDVMRTLIDIGNGNHPVGVMDRHVIVALLRASRAEGWEFIERFLLAAQRQEGLRQSILEAVDEGHPVAFLRMLDLILEHKLLRFAAAVRAVAVWIGFPADVQEIPKITERVTTLRAFRMDPVACERALHEGDAWDTYLGLCSVAMQDVQLALQWADAVMRRESVDARAAAVRFIATTKLTSATTRLLAALDDADIDVAALAAAHIHFPFGRTGDKPPANAFEPLERLALRLPAGDRSGSIIGIETVGPSLSRAPVIANMLTALNTRSLSAIKPWVADMDPATRSRLATTMGDRVRMTADMRDVLIGLVGDRSSDVRRNAVKAMEQLRVDRDEAPALEALLTRKAGDLRRGVIKLLSAQRADDAVASADRLWASNDPACRDAACELLGAIPGRPETAKDMARRFMADEPTELQREHLRATLGDGLTPGASDSGATALFDPNGRTPRRAPKRCPTPGAKSGAAQQVVSALDSVAHQHRDTVLTVHNFQGSTEMLLADIRWLPSPFQHRRAPQETDTEVQGLVLSEVFHEWWSNRPAACRDGSGNEALRAYASAARDAGLAYRRNDQWWWSILGSVTGNSGEPRHRPVVEHVLQWLVFEEATTTTIDECLDAYETALSQIPPATLQATPKLGDGNEHAYYVEDWRHTVGQGPWRSVLLGLLVSRPELFDSHQLVRWLGISRWLDEPVPESRRHPVMRPLLLAAEKAGAATDDDIRDGLLTPGIQLLKTFTRRRRQSLHDEHPRVVELADEIRQRVLEIERARGELPTSASTVAVELGSISGVGLTMELLGRLGRASLVRGWTHGNLGREAVFSHLLRVSYPAEGDDAAGLRASMKTSKVTDKRLVELAVFAPQWARLAGEALEWDGFEDAVWWFHAHTKDTQWSIDAEVRDSWTALSAERTSLSGDDLLEGAVDYEWFHRAYRTLGATRWATVHAAAKMGSGGSGHRRAQLFAEAMLGEVREATLLERMAATRHQDSVRALGLIPLPSDQPDRDNVTLQRYLALREYERGSSKFGSQRQTSERTAVRIGIENLARSAGYIDPQRFVWAMEAAEAGALADGPIVAIENDVSVSLSVDEEGVAALAVTRSGKALKSIPADLRKTPAFAELRDRKTALTRQATRVRASLESAMIREERFSDGDLAALDRHPVVAPMLRLLLFVDDSGRIMRRNAGGYTDTADVHVSPVGQIRLAHPADLLRSGEWIAWQERLFIEERRQPFKQVFRELYNLTETERSQGPGSHRYDGNQIQPRQAMALFSRRGWLADRENGDVSRVFHQHGFVARVQFANGFLTALEVELPTLQGVYFTYPGQYVAQPIDSVPAVVFSETMRDLDLVVSVAHAGGVDPESTASTVEMRAALIRETARLTRLDNVRLVESHAIIDGALGEYSVHLGSGVVHRRPGGSVCIIPVDSQRRGRIFLPFADDDPKTAEVVAKVLLLARDTQIKDPSILEQLRS